MSVGSVMGAGLQGIQNGMEGLQKNATDIANFATEDNADAVDLAESMVDMKLNELQVKASSQVLQVAGETIGTLLDIRA